MIPSRNRRKKKKKYKENPQTRRKIFANHISNKGILYGIYQQFIQYTRSQFKK